MDIIVKVPAEIGFPTTGTYTCNREQGLVPSSGFNCDYDATARTIKIAGQLTSSTAPGVIGFTVNDLSTPSSYGETASFSIQTQVKISSTDYDIDLISNDLTLMFECDTTCLTCHTIKTNCTSCSAPRYLISNECLTTCPDGFYGENAACSACDASCKTCSGKATTCLSCADSMILYENECLSSCPSGKKESGSNPITCVDGDREIIIPFPFLLASFFLITAAFIAKWIKRGT